MRRIKLEDKHYQWGLTAFLVIICGALFIFGVYRFHVVQDFISLCGNILAPFIYGLVMAYLLCPIYNATVRETYHLLNKGDRHFTHDMAISKVIGTVISMLVLLVVIIGVAWMVIPGLIDSIVKVVDVLPAGMQKFQIWIDHKMANLPVAQSRINAILEETSDQIMDFAKNTLLPRTGTMAARLSGTLLGAIGVLFDFVIGFIICVYFLNIKDTLSAQMKKIIIANTKESTAEEIFAGAEFTNKTFGGFISGKLIDSAIIGIICFIVMSIFGWEYTLLISCIIGITNIIPFFGPFIGAIPSALLLLMVNPWHALYFIVFVIVLQQFDGNILGPKILGETTGLASFWVLFAILVGGGLFGPIGMVLGVPVFAVLYTYGTRVLNKKLKRKGFSTDTSDYKVDKYRTKPHTKTLKERREEKRQRKADQKAKRQKEIAEEHATTEESEQTNEHTED